MLTFILPLALQAIVPKEVRPPKLCFVAGITTGLTTIEQFERRYGRARRITGGHSGGAGLWYDRRTGVLLHADGFNIAKDGEVLDGLSIDWLPAKDIQKGVPTITLRKSDLGLLTKLRKGMSVREVETQIGQRLNQRQLRLKGLIRYSSKLINKQDDRYTAWHMTFQFGAKGLRSFSVTCD